MHDLRHFAATTMLSSQVPLAMASKTMRHSTLSTTTEGYGHLLRHVAQQAVDARNAAFWDELIEYSRPDDVDASTSTSIAGAAAGSDADGERSSTASVLAA